MERELDPGIFGDSGTQKSNLEFNHRQLHRRCEDIESSISQIRSELKQLKDSNLQLNSFVKEQAKLSQIRFQKLIERLKAGESRLADLAKAQTIDLRQLRSQIKDQRVFDEKVQHMVERHNQVIHTFENRLQALKRQLNEKELKLAQYQSIPR